MLSSKVTGTFQREEALEIKRKRIKRQSYCTLLDRGSGGTHPS